VHEVVQVPARGHRGVVRVLQVQQVLSREGLASEQVGHVLGLEVELLDRVPGVDVPGGPHRHHVRVVREHLVCDRAMPAAVGVLLHVQPDELLGCKRLAVQRVLPVLFHIRHDLEDVKNHPFFCTHRGLVC